ncbi:hypothetical protein SGPA1_20541 [Streptomyces misionensis JCM 4497]
MARSALGRAGRAAGPRPLPGADHRRRRLAGRQAPAAHPPDPHRPARGGVPAGRRRPSPAAARRPGEPDGDRPRGADPQPRPVVPARRGRPAGRGLRHPALRHHRPAPARPPRGPGDRAGRVQGVRPGMSPPHGRPRTPVPPPP